MATYVYVLGGAVSWLRLKASRIPPDVGLAGADSKQILAQGFRVIAFELTLTLLALVTIGIVWATAHLLRWLATVRKQQSPSENGEAAVPRWDWWRDPREAAAKTVQSAAAMSFCLALAVPAGFWRVCTLVLALLAALIAMLIAATSPDHRRPPGAGDPPRTPALGDDDPPWSDSEAPGSTAAGGSETSPTPEGRKPSPSWWVAPLLLVTVANLVLIAWVLPAVQGLLLLSLMALVYAGTWLDWPERQTWEWGRAIRWSGLWALLGLATLVALAWVASQPVLYDRARVRVVPVAQRACPSKHKCLWAAEGAYVGRTDRGVYLAVCDAPGRAVRLRLYGASQVRRMTFGGMKYAFDDGHNPTLLNVALAALGDDRELTRDAALTTRLRDGHDACE